MLEVASRIDRVVVHPGAAMVTRIASATLTASGEVAFVGLPAGLDEDSLEVEVSGPARATSVRSTLAVVTTEAGGSDADRRAGGAGGAARWVTVLHADAGRPGRQRRDRQQWSR